MQLETPRSVRDAGPGDEAEQAAWSEFARATTPEALARSWLALQGGAIAGTSAGLVLLGPADSGPFTPVAVWPDPQRDLRYLGATAHRALTERRGVVARREAAGGVPEGYDVAYPLEVEGHVHGAVVLDLAPRPERELQRALWQVHWGAGWLEALVRRQEAARDIAVHRRLQTVLDLAAAAVGPERFHAGATAFATALATRLGCDRVSLGFVRRGRVHVRAMSHSARFGAETNLMRAIAAAMDEALDQQAPVVHPPPPGSPARVTRAHAELARQHGSGAICSVPLADATRVFGVLTLERPAERPFDAEAVMLVEAVAGLVGPVLEAQRREDRWLGTKAAESARRLLGILVGPRHLGAKLVTAAVAGVVLFLAFARAEYRVSAPAVMEASTRRALVVPFDGFVAEAPARAGDVVTRGQLLARLDDREMRLERLRWLSQEDQLARQSNQALAGHNAAQVRILAAQIDQARAQIALLDDQLARVRVVAPFDGVVVTGDLSQALGSPVERGRVLFEVAPLEAYRAALQVDERDIAEVRVGQGGDLVLSGLPAERLTFAVERVTPVSTTREGRNYFRVEGRLTGAPGGLRPGLEGIGKVRIDRRHLVWIWTHQVVDWLRLKLWAWRP